MNRDLEHLLTLARRGGRGGASGGERRCFNIVKCLLDERPLDLTASSGILQLAAAIYRCDYDIIDRFSDAIDSASVDAGQLEELPNGEFRDHREESANDDLLREI